MEVLLYTTPAADVGEDLLLAPGLEGEGIVLLPRRLLLVVLPLLLQHDFAHDTQLLQVKSVGITASHGAEGEVNTDPLIHLLHDLYEPPLEGLPPSFEQTNDLFHLLLIVSFSDVLGRLL